MSPRRSPSAKVTVFTAPTFGEGDLVGGAGEEITTVAPLLRTHQTRPDESHDDAA